MRYHEERAIRPNGQTGEQNPAEGQRAPIQPGQVLVYEATWMGIPVANATIHVYRRQYNSMDGWSVVADLRSHPVLDPVFYLRDRICEGFNSGSFLPRIMTINQHENHTRNDYLIKFDPQRGHIETLRRNRRGTQRLHFWLANAFGPFSGAFSVLSQPLSVGKHQQVLIFTGTAYYTIDLHVETQQSIRSALGEIRAFRVRPRLILSSDSSVVRTVKKVNIWVNAQEPWIPVQVEALSFVGPVRADLISVGSDQTASRRFQGATGSLSCESLFASVPSLQDFSLASLASFQAIQRQPISEAVDAATEPVALDFR